MTVRRDHVHTARLVLRPWQAADVPALRRLLVDEEIRAHLGGPVDVADLDARLEAELAPSRTGSWAVTTSSDGRVVGWVSLEVDDAEAEVSWQLLPECRGRGYAREAAATAIDLAWTDTDVQQVVAVTQEGNGRSRRLAEALGMRLDSSFEQWGATQVRFVLHRPIGSRGADEFLSTAIDHLAGSPGCHAVGVLGSWARGEARAGSDVDLLVVVEERGRWLADTTWMGRIATWSWWRDEDWGLVTSRRVAHVDGPEVEYGLTTREWATPPIDAATARVARDGLRALHDPDGVFAAMRAWPAAHG